MIARAALFGFSLLSLTLLVHTASHAETFFGPTSLENKSFDHLTINGPANLIKVRVKSLTVHGLLQFNELEVEGNTRVEGPTTGENGHFQKVTAYGPVQLNKVTLATLKVSGPATLTNFTIKGSTKIDGPLQAEKGVFQDLTAGSNTGAESVRLTDVAVKNIVINNGLKEETLRLSGNTAVSGSITFKSGKGKIEKIGNNVIIRNSGEKNLETPQKDPGRKES